MGPLCGAETRLTFNPAGRTVVPGGPLLPSAKRALQIVADARQAGHLHSAIWAKRLNDNAPEMNAIIDRTSRGGLRTKMLVPVVGERAPVAFLPATNPYAAYLDEFEAGGRHLAEALQRPVLLIDPAASILVSPSIDLRQLIQQGSSLGVLTEGAAQRAFETWLKNPDLRRAIRCAACIHPPNPESLPEPLPTYLVTSDSTSGPTWHGLPPTPLALSRWLPEIDTYLDALRVWFDLYLD